MRELSTVERATLINAIASREGTAKELAKWYDITTFQLKAFLEDNRQAIEMAREALTVADEEDTSTNLDISPRELAELWITNKAERLNRYEIVADWLLAQIMTGQLSGADMSTCLREFRSYAIAAANELGQLLHRGSGEGAGGDTMSIDIQGVDVGNLM